MANKPKSQRNWSIKKLAPIGLWLSAAAVFIGILLLLLKLIIYIGIYTPPSQKFINPALWICLGMAVIGPALYALLDPKKAREFLAGRQARHGSNAVIMLVAFLVILIIINVFVFQNPIQWDWTEGQQNTLAPETLDTLKSLPSSAKAIGFFTSQLSNSNAKDLFIKLKANSNGKFDYQFVDPSTNPALANQYKVTIDGSVVLILNDHQEVLTSITEQNVTNALVRLMNPGQRTVYFLAGHGERDIQNSSNETYTRAKSVLEAKNYTVRSLNLLAQNSIPEDALAIIIAGPTSPLSEGEATLLEKYLDNGGSIIVMEEPSYSTSSTEPTTDPLMDYLKSVWGITFNNNMIIDPSSSQLVIAVEYTYGSHAITNNLVSQNLVTFFPTARSISIDSSLKNINSTALVNTIDRSWGETDFTALQNNQVAYDPGTDMSGPLTVAVASERTGSSKGRVVAFGDVDFASDAYFDQYGNSDMFINSVDWAAGQENMISLTAKTPITREMKIPSSGTMLLLAILFIIVLPGAVIAAGISSWISRRRRG